MGYCTFLGGSYMKDCDILGVYEKGPVPYSSFFNAQGIRKGLASLFLLHMETPKSLKFNP